MSFASQHQIAHGHSQAFLSHFHEFWPNTLKFIYRERLVTAADWPSIVNTARLSSSRVLLVLKLG